MPTPPPSGNISLGSPSGTKQAWSASRAAIAGSVNAANMPVLSIQVMPGFRRRRVYFAFIPSGMGNGYLSISLSLATARGVVQWSVRDIIGNSFLGFWADTSGTAWFGAGNTNASRADFGGLPSYALIKTAAGSTSWPTICSQGNDAVQFMSVWRPTGVTGGEEVWQVVCLPISLNCDADILELRVLAWNFPTRAIEASQEYFIGCLSDP